MSLGRGASGGEWESGGEEEEEEGEEEEKRDESSGKMVWDHLQSIILSHPVGRKERVRLLVLATHLAKRIGTVCLLLRDRTDRAKD